MRREDRAKQFLPFDAMKGLQEALREREEKVLRVPRREPDEERVAAINEALSLAQKGDLAEVVYFKDGSYSLIQSIVKKVDVVEKYLVVGGLKIPFSDVFDLKLQKE